MASTTRLGFLAPITTRVFNPVTRLFAGWLPGLGIVTHIGRGTGRTYRSPVLVLQRGDHHVIGLWYGSNVHWVKNIVAAGQCGLRVRGRDIQLVEPELLVDPDGRLLPPPLRLAGRLVHLTEFLRLRAGAPAGA